MFIMLSQDRIKCCTFHTTFFVTKREKNCTMEDTVPLGKKNKTFFAEYFEMYFHFIDQRLSDSGRERREREEIRGEEYYTRPRNIKIYLDDCWATILQPPPREGLRNSRFQRMPQCSPPIHERGRGGKFHSLPRRNQA